MFRRSTFFVITLINLAACSGGGGGSSPPPPPPTNMLPFADAGPDQSAVEGDTVTLDAASSSDPDGTIAAYTWSQVSGPSVVLSDPASVTPQFQAPDVSVETVLSFSLRVRDNSGGTDTDTVDVTVMPSDIRVFTTSGVFEGEALQGGVTVFRSMPYAEPPVGELRWRAPQPLTPFTDVQEAKVFRSNCWQLPNPYAPGDSDADDISEDCLHINVWSPDLDPGAKAQVMFWIHGGGNYAGTADKSLYDGEAFARDYGVVLVSAKYRLGPMGYLAHRDLNEESASGASGNYGLMDIISALEWTRDNIENFGGDPDSVMIFGESGGAVNVCNMIVSPLAAGLFHHAIMQSGPCETPIQDLFQPTDRSDESAIETGDRAAVATRCDDATDVLACMRALSAEELFEALDPAADRFFDEGDVYQPITDGYVLPDAPLDIIAAGDHNRTPLLMGTNDNEAGLWHVVIESLITGVTSYELIVESLFDDDDDLIPNGPSAQILAAYPAATREEAVEAFERLFTDANFICTARRTARAMAEYSEPVWLYHFTRVPFGLREFGAFHGAELPYVFDTFDDVVVYGPADEALSENIRDYWVQFARIGDPNDPGLLPWPRYEDQLEEYIVLDEPLYVSARLRESQCDLLDSIR